MIPPDRMTTMRERLGIPMPGLFEAWEQRPAGQVGVGGVASRNDEPPAAHRAAISGERKWLHRPARTAFPPGGVEGGCEAGSHGRGRLPTQDELLGWLAAGHRLDELTGDDMTVSQRPPAAVFVLTSLLSEILGSRFPGEGDSRARPPQERLVIVTRSRPV